MKSDKISINDAEKTLVLKTWYASVFVLPIAKRLIVFFSNYKILTPNQITLTALVFRVFAASFFVCGSYRCLIFGAIFYYLAYLLDCVDGSVARLTNQASTFGRYLDHISDLVGDILILCALAFSKGLLFTYMVLGMVFMHIAESYISYVANFAIANRNTNSNFILFKAFNKYKKWWFDRNFKSFLSFPDYTAFVFIFMPLLNRPKEGLHIGFYLLFIIVCYTILSTFIALHTNEKRFP